MCVGLEESLLQDIVGIVVILSNLLCHPEDAPVVVTDEFGKSSRIAGFGARNERGLTVHEVQARTAIRVETLAKELKNVPNLYDSGDRRWIHHDVLVEFRRRAMEFLQAYFRDNRMAMNSFAQRRARVLERLGDGAMILPAALMLDWLADKHGHEPAAQSIGSDARDHANRRCRS